MSERYPSLDESIRAAYADPIKTTLKTSLYESHIRAIRWALLRTALLATLSSENEFALWLCAQVASMDAAIALASVAGYTVGNDVLVRDGQQDTPTMWPGESFDTHGPLGLWITRQRRWVVKNFSIRFQASLAESGSGPMPATRSRGRSARGPASASLRNAWLAAGYSLTSWITPALSRAASSRRAAPRSEGSRPP